MKLNKLTSILLVTASLLSTSVFAVNDVEDVLDQSTWLSMNDFENYSLFQKYLSRMYYEAGKERARLSALAKEEARQGVIDGSSGEGVSGKQMVVDADVIADSDALKISYELYLEDADGTIEDPFKSFTTFLPDSYQSSLSASEGELNVYKSNMSAAVINETREAYLKSRKEDKVLRKEGAYDLYSSFNTSEGFDHEGYAESLEGWKESSLDASNSTHETYNSDLNALFNTYKIKLITDAAEIKKKNGGNVSNMVFVMKSIDHEKLTALNELYTASLDTMPDLITSAANAITLAGSYSGECGAACTVEVPPVVPPVAPEVPVEPKPKPVHIDICEDYDGDLPAYKWKQICRFNKYHEVGFWESR